MGSQEKPPVQLRDPVVPSKGPRIWEGRRGWVGGEEPSGKSSFSLGSIGPKLFWGTNTGNIILEPLFPNFVS